MRKLTAVCGVLMFTASASSAEYAPNDDSGLSPSDHISTGPVASIGIDQGRLLIPSGCADAPGNWIHNNPDVRGFYKVRSNGSSARVTWGRYTHDADQFVIATLAPGQSYFHACSNTTIKFQGASQSLASLEISTSWGTKYHGCFGGQISAHSGAGLVDNTIHTNDLSVFDSTTYPLIMSDFYSYGCGIAALGVDSLVTNSPAMTVAYEPLSSLVVPGSSVNRRLKVSVDSEIADGLYELRALISVKGRGAASGVLNDSASYVLRFNIDRVAPSGLVQNASAKYVGSIKGQKIGNRIYFQPSSNPEQVAGQIAEWYQVKKLSNGQPIGMVYFKDGSSGYADANGVVGDKYSICLQDKAGNVSSNCAIVTAAGSKSR